MKVLLAAGIFPPDAGGPATYVPTLAAALHSRGHEVRVVCVTSEPPALDYPFEVSWVDRKMGKLSRSVRVIRELTRTARSSDVVLANGVMIEAWIAARLAGRPLVVKVVGDKAWEISQIRGWFKGTIDDFQVQDLPFRCRLLKTLMRNPIRRADRVVVPSEYLASLVRNWPVPDSRLSVVYNAVAEPTVKRAEMDRDFVQAAVVCRLVPWKGVGTIIDAAATLPNLQLAILGDGPLLAELTEYCVRRGLSDRVKFYGNRTRDEVRAVLRDADLFVQNSTYEGLPHTVLEAMQEGAVVVASDAGGTSEVIENGVNGLMFPPGSERALADAITAVATDSGLRSVLRKNAYATLAGRFSIKHMIDMTEATLQSAVNAA